MSKREYWRRKLLPMLELLAEHQEPELQTEVIDPSQQSYLERVTSLEG